jgi:hypothetical protein
MIHLGIWKLGVSIFHSAVPYIPKYYYITEFLWSVAHSVLPVPVALRSAVLDTQTVGSNPV